MPDILYTEATEREVAAIAKLRAVNSGNEEHWKERITGYHNGLIHPQKAKPERTILIASHQSEVIGWIAGHLTERFNCDGELQWLDVRSDYRRKGIASTLWNELSEWFIKNNSYKICVDPGNEEARKFYANNGAANLDDHWMYWPDIREARK
ncbi:GNAT family N-acetyltransferase [Sediminibacterium roseum]|uniref:GNAT family N-acetyltransferase n=1 Tax=Sediminibacterium roseum TaxID=1978412 RepID=A0ABX0A0H6_9BACT|nr:GNAT family N-acetyltransferase [Sediminibacterium roseum]NCI52039.1 GNAT family N-acetyltransferase [Sediminibacterium roseum]